MEQAKTEGAARYSRLLTRQGIHTPWGREMGAQLGLRYTDAIKAWAEQTVGRKAGQLIPQAERILTGSVEEIAFVTMRTIFAGMSEDRTLTGIANEIGTEIDKELSGQKAWTHPDHDKAGILRYYKHKLPRKGMLRNVSTGIFNNLGGGVEWSTRQRIRLGIRLLYIFKDLSGIIQFVNVGYGNKMLRTQVVVTDEAQEWIRKYNEHAEFLRPLRYPTVIPPKNWTGLWGGGYHTDIVYPLIKIKRKSDIEWLKKHPLNLVTEGVNATQAVAWRVNKRILEVMREYHRQGLNVNEVIPFSGSVQLPSRFQTDDIEQIKEYKRQAYQAHLTNYQNKAKAVSIAKLLCTAETMKKYDQIYFPIQLDFRGRMYCFNETLHYQGGDTARALLEFQRAVPLGEDGMYWLAIHGANKWGMDKRPFVERVSWVTSNIENIKRCADDPVLYTWWTMAEEPWQFLAFCMEYATATPDSLSRLPCSLDATNNGLQILSMLMRDPEGAKRTNVAQTDEPCDLYQAVAEALIERLSTMNTGYAQALLDAGVINRKLVKVAVMTIPYGVTHYGITGNIDDALGKILFDSPEAQKIIPMSQKREVSKWVVSILVNVMHPFVGKSREAMRWLKDLARPVANAERVCRWITPSGFPVNNEYRLTRRLQVCTAIGEKFDYREAQEETPKLDPRASVRTISPNFIHSLDASIAHLTARELGQENIDFGIVHDCFFAHASNLNRVRSVVRRKYHEVFKRDMLENLRQQFIHQHRDLAFEPVPTLGDFVVDEILRSDYFLS